MLLHVIHSCIRVWHFNQQELCGYDSRHMCNSMDGLIAYSPYLLQKELCQTERTLSIPLVDSRGYGHMAAMDPAGSAVLDQIFDGAGHLLEALEAN